MSGAYTTEIIVLVLMGLSFAAYSMYKRLNEKSGIHYTFFVMLIASIAFTITATINGELETDDDADTDIGSICDVLGDSLSSIAAMGLLIFNQKKEGTPMHKLRLVLYFVTPTLFALSESMDLVDAGTSKPFFLLFTYTFGAIGFYGMMACLLIASVATLFGVPDYSCGEPSTKFCGKLKIVALTVLLTIILCFVQDMADVAKAETLSAWFDAFSDITMLMVPMWYFFCTSCSGECNEKQTTSTLSEPLKLDAAATGPLLAQA